MELPNAAHETFAPAVIRLLRGPVYEDDGCWQLLRAQQKPIQDWLGKIGLELRVHDGDGFAYIAQPTDEDGSDPLPRLMNKASLGYVASLLCILLRQLLEEFDARSTSINLFITQAEMKEALALFLKDQSNRSKQLRELSEPIKRLEGIGILKLRRGDEQNADNNQYEVKRIIKAIVGVEQLEGFRQKLSNHAEPLHE